MAEAGGLRKRFFLALNGSIGLCAFEQPVQPHGRCCHIQARAIPASRSRMRTRRF